MIQRTGQRRVREQVFAIHEEFITLGQLIKVLGWSDTGGGVKEFLAEAGVLVNGEEETRRGRKLRVGDKIAVADEAIVRIVAGESEEKE